MSTINQVFGRTNNEGNVEIFDESGEACTRLDANVYPVGSSVSARYEHADGITLTAEDAARIGIAME